VKCTDENVIVEDATVLRFGSFHTGKFERAFFVNHLTTELNPSAQRCLARIFIGDFAS
jgi:hypothetical protein